MVISKDAKINSERKLLIKNKSGTQLRTIFLLKKWHKTSVSKNQHKTSHSNNLFSPENLP